jgi:hypothetical protein
VIQIVDRMKVISHVKDWKPVYVEVTVADVQRIEREDQPDLFKVIFTDGTAVFKMEWEM